MIHVSPLASEHGRSHFHYGPALGFEKGLLLASRLLAVLGLINAGYFTYVDCTNKWGP